jgi:bifunctional DNase/RNase
VAEAAVTAEPVDRAEAAPDGAGRPVTPPDAVARLAARTFRVVRVVSVHVPLPEQYPVVVLEDAEVEGRRLSFRIGTAEGAALAHALRGTRAARPLTQDLFCQALERFGIDVLAVRLTARVGPTHLAEIELVGPGGSQVLACRPSDGLCLALGRRVPAPVLVDDRLFSADGDVADGAVGDPTGEAGPAPDAGGPGDEPLAAGTAGPDAGT